MQPYDPESVIYKSAKSFLGYHRLDLACKFLYIEDFYKKNYDKHIIELYKKHILCRTGGAEPKDRFIPRQDVKDSINDYIKSFNELIISMSKHGYDKKFPIRFSKHGITNGAHRIACAIYFNVPIACIEVNKNGKGTWDRKWFEKNNFSESDIVLLENTTRKLLNE